MATLQYLFVGELLTQQVDVDRIARDHLARLDCRTCAPRHVLCPTRTQTNDVQLSVFHVSSYCFEVALKGLSLFNTCDCDGDATASLLAKHEFAARRAGSSLANVVNTNCAFHEIR